MTYRSVYVHVPFCRHRCGYCDFTLVAGRDDLIGDYLDALDLELKRVEGVVEIDTLFFGGGTPTHLPPEALRRLFEIVLSRFRLASGYEFSVEANPANLSLETVDVLAQAGVNRVSLGAQSFDSRSLAMLERDHRAEDIELAVRWLRRQGIANLSLDLIFGVPGQNLAEWRETIRRAIELQPPHVSAYGLTFEKGTAFWTRRQKGQLEQADEELERAMYAVAMEELPAARLVQYELSNYAHAGFECRHNAMYWSGEPFEAFGPGAARLIDGVRQTNHRSVFTWIKRLQSGESPVGETDPLTAEGRARELIFVGLRRTSGIDRRIFESRTSLSLDALAGGSIRRQTSLGLLEDTGTHIRLTREGRFVADSVIAEFL
ncbi:MAG: radical SAM family heme chaperone HemW [Planctomycetaceae bacterium]|nr:radical SAM family heme chaperone HemW [Planctomycetaceae bacterium]